MKIVITGGAGYIGSVLTPKLLSLGHQVTVIDNFMFRQSTLLDCCQYENFTPVNADCRDMRMMKEHVRDADVIIPLAAIVGVPLCSKMPLETVSLNKQAIFDLCDVLSKEQRVLIPCTNSGYGIGTPGEFCTEESPLRPISLYGTTKVEAEARVLERENGLSFRLATVFGMSPRMRTDLLVNDFVYRAIYDRSLVIFEGHFKRNFIHIQDVVRAFIHGIDNFETMRGKPYNVGLEGANLSKLELASLIQKMVPDFCYHEADIFEDPDKRNYIVSNRRILNTGFQTQWDLERGVRELIKGFTIIKNNAFSNI